MRSGIVVVALIGLALTACAAPSGSATPSASGTPSTSVPTTTVSAVYACAPRAVTWDGTSAIDLTGTWAGDDAGVYYLRQIDDQVWWLGMSGVGGPVEDRGYEWTNVYLGTLAGDTITGEYVDVPQGANDFNSPLVMKLTPTSDGGITLVKETPETETPFGGNVFTPCTLE